jgi:hypothetical protein
VEDQAMPVRRVIDHVLAFRREIYSEGRGNSSVG